VQRSTRAACKGSAILKSLKNVFKNGAGWAPGPVRAGQTQEEENDLFCGWSAAGADGHKFCIFNQSS